MTTKAKQLEETKGKFRVVGKVKGIENEKSFSSGVTKNGDEYQRIAFLVESSPNNTVPVELFGIKTDTCLFMNFKEKDKRKVRKEVAWDDRYDNHGDYMLVGSATVKLDENESKSDRITQFEAVENIYETLEDGDWVDISGQTSFQEYEGQDGKKVRAYKFQISSIKKVKEKDFEDEKYKEVNEFSQSCVIADTVVDKENKRMLIEAKVIDYKGNIVDATFVVDTDRYKKLATNLKKRLKFGDQIRLTGNIKNLVEYIKEEEVDDVDDEDWGGDSVSIDESYQRNITKELAVTGVSKGSHIKEKYTEDELFNEDVENYGSDEEMDEDFDDELDDDDLDLEDEDLPFGDDDE